MPTDLAMRVCMQTLVLINLVFVQLTGVASLHWLLPLYALALGAPLLKPFREGLLYRLLWNGGVMAFFAILVRHAMDADLAYVLEDGLVLAALCQVHLLNNLRSNQRPDILFFNAFLIAIITGFMNQGLGFPLAFLAFAPCYVIGLQLLNATRGRSGLSPAVTRRLVIDGGRRAAVLLGLSLLVFLFWPRNFQRKAYFHGKLVMSSAAPSQLEVGFSEELVLGRDQPVRTTDAEALRVTLLDGESSDLPRLWRGATLSTTDGRAWRPIHPGRLASGRRLEPSDLPWQRSFRGLVRTGPMPSKSLRVEVVRHEQQTERLFAPLGARALLLAPEHSRTRLRGRADGTIDASEGGAVRYELTLADESLVELGGARLDPLPAQLGPYVELPDNLKVRAARKLAARLTRNLPAETEQQEIVQILCDHLSETFDYVPPGSEGAADSIDEFLSRAAGGHCEFFASALATMLRSVDIPCRVVTGFRGSRWDAQARVLSFGTRDAHAWVEVFDPKAGWYTVDPSPSSAATGSGVSLWARLRTGMHSAWARLTKFNSERRAVLFSQLLRLPARILQAARERPLDTALMASLLTLPLTLIVRRRSSRTRPEVRGYRSALRRAKLRLLPGETPRELLQRARSQSLPRARLQAIEQATELHERARYAN